MKRNLGLFLLGFLSALLTLKVTELFTSDPVIALGLWAFLTLPIGLIATGSIKLTKKGVV
jgi:hypothetical protein